MIRNALKPICNVFVQYSTIGQDAGHPNKFWEYHISLSRYFGWYIGGIIPPAKLQSERFAWLIGLQAEYPASFNVMNETWQSICKFRKGLENREMLQFLDLPAVHAKRTLWPQLKYCFLDRQERWLFKTSEQRFRETWGIERKTGVQKHVFKHKIKDVCLNSCKNGQTCRCFRDNVI